jgi:hypothetical protein
MLLLILAILCSPPNPNEPGNLHTIHTIQAQSTYTPIPIHGSIVIDCVWARGSSVVLQFFEY